MTKLIIIKNSPAARNLPTSYQQQNATTTQINTRNLEKEMQELKPNEQRSQNAMILIWIALAMNCISLVSSYFQYDLLQTAANGGEIATEAVTSNDNREQAIGIIQLIVFVVSAITFIQWFRRAYFNLHLRVNRLSHTQSLGYEINI